MPIYTYRGPCGHEWEEVRSIQGSEVSQESCPTCRQAVADDVPSGKPELGRKVPSSGVSTHFKGSGWTPKFYPNKS